MGRVGALTIPLARKVDGKKYLWDGEVYDNHELVQKVMADYQKDGFEVQVFPEGDQYLVYSRRVAVTQSAG